MDPTVSVSLLFYVIQFSDQFQEKNNLFIVDTCICIFINM